MSSIKEMSPHPGGDKRNVSQSPYPIGDEARCTISLYLPRSIWLVIERQARRKKKKTTNFVLEQLVPWIEQLKINEKDGLNEED